MSGGRVPVVVIGQRFGRLVVRDEWPDGRIRRCRVLCDCGTEKVIAKRLLLGGISRSCGCLRQNNGSTVNLKDGRYRLDGNATARTHSTWSSMMSRCYRPGTNGFARYGGRGVRVCERWHTFEAFVADVGLRPEGCTLDRIDGSGNYEPGNVRWATREEQDSNKSTNVFLTVGGTTKTLAQWSRHTGISTRAIESRVKRGWSPDDVVGRPVRLMKRSNAL